MHSLSFTQIGPSMDVETGVKVWEVFLLVSLVLTVVLNVALLGRIVQMADGLVAVITGARGPRFQTLISMSIGDIMLALFPLLMEVRTRFELNRDRNMSDYCRMGVLSYYYVEFIMPLVYIVGLLVLTIDCCLFRLRNATAIQPSPGVMVSLAVSAVPWIIGFIIALSLTTIIEDLHNCDETFSSHCRSNFEMSLCLIASTAVAIVATTTNLICSLRQDHTPSSTQLPARSGQLSETPPQCDDETGEAAEAQSRAAPELSSHLGVSNVQLKHSEHRASDSVILNHSQYGGSALKGQLRYANKNQVTNNFRVHYSQCGPLPSISQQVSQSSLQPGQAESLPPEFASFTVDSLSSPDPTANPRSNLDPTANPRSDLDPAPNPRSSLAPLSTRRHLEAIALLVSSLALAVCVLPWSIVQLSSAQGFTKYMVDGLTILRSSCMPLIWLASRSLKR